MAKHAFAAAIAMACASCLGARAVCLDENLVSGYHIPLEKEFRESELVMIGQVLSDRETPEPGYPLDRGHTYTLKVIEVLRGKAGKRVELFTEYNSGQFPMDIGKTYLVFASTRVGLLSASDCGSSGEVKEKAREIAQVRKLAAAQRTSPRQGE